MNYTQLVHSEASRVTDVADVATFTIFLLFWIWPFAVFHPYQYIISLHKIYFFYTVNS